MDMHEKGEQKELISTVLYSIVFSLTLTILIYSIYKYPPDVQMGFFEKQQAISTNFKLILFLGVIAMTMIVSLLMLVTNIYLSDKNTFNSRVNQMDKNIKSEIKEEIKKNKKSEINNKKSKK